jgi:hypothetical protein
VSSEWTQDALRFTLYAQRQRILIFLLRKCGIVARISGTKGNRQEGTLRQRLLQLTAESERLLVVRIEAFPYWLLTSRFARLFTECRGG